MMQNRPVSNQVKACMHDELTEHNKSPLSDVSFFSLSLFDFVFFGVLAGLKTDGPKDPFLSCL